MDLENDFPPLQPGVGGSTETSGSDLSGAAAALQIQLLQAELCALRKELDSTKSGPVEVPTKPKWNDVVAQSSSPSVVFSNGNSAVVSVHYPWKPLRCSGCGIFGHPNDKCPEKEKVVPTKLDEMVVPPVDVGVQQPDLALVSPGLKAQLGGSSVTPPPSKTVHGSVGIVQQSVGDLEVVSPSSKGSMGKGSSPRSVGRISGSSSSQVPSKGVLSNSFSVLDSTLPGEDEFQSGLVQHDGAKPDAGLVAPALCPSGGGPVSPKIASYKKKGRPKGGGGAKVRDVNLASTVSRCFPAHWNCSNNLGSTLVASIFVAWDPQMLVVDIILVSAQMITAKVQVAASQRVFFLSIVYGSNNAVDRRTLWNELSVLKSICGDAAWVMMGDFNVVRKRSERLHGFDSNAVDDFNSCLDGLDMDDMPTNGFWFSWSNKRGGLGDNKSKLDRALVNPGWINEFPNSDAWLLAPGVSNHCSLLVSVLPVSQTKKPFKFFNFWMKHHSFKDLLVQSWNAPVDGSSSLLQFSLKLKRLKLVLKDLNKRCFSNLCSRVGQAREELCHLQSLCFSNPHDADLCAKEKELLRSFMELSLAEEDFKKQKSRVKWLSLGDHNTRFFHQKMASHRLRSKILSLVDARGVRIEDPAAIKDEILSYYEGLLGGPFTPSGNFSCELRAAISNKLSADKQLSLVQARLEDQYLPKHNGTPPQPPSSTVPLPWRADLRSSAVSDPSFSSWILGGGGGGPAGEAVGGGVNIAKSFDLAIYRKKSRRRMR
ncbi:hypothetical protein Vadar_027677 [Vaccinium darrowii]|uniref:Uncharacterized protein n=1 Tax=Vaccinium darrowii TaxID=229202 RepID=A0ACB7YAV4_9ERIC|nr:hypothetical protein Vadar_027677 [Vaccinium darrowii]